MKILAKSVIVVVITISLTACLPPGVVDPGSPGGAVVGPYETVTSLLTRTPPGGLFPSIPSPAVFTGTPSSVPALTVEASQTPLMLVSATVSPNQQPSVSENQHNCNLAQAGLPIDISVPDETAFQPGEHFTKVWRVVNAGSCAWNPEYAVVWFSGDDLGMNRVQPVGMQVAPGQAVDLAVDMAAPESPGIYQSNWKLSDNEGRLFGIGPNGDAPFWVRIVVDPPHTPTPEPTAVDPTAVVPPVILAQGTVAVILDQPVDLNTWNSDPLVVEDLELRLSETDELGLVPVNGAKLDYFGITIPSFAECIQMPVRQDPTLLKDFPPGAYYCYRTADDKPGRLMISAFDPQLNQINLEFITWVP